MKSIPVRESDHDVKIRYQHFECLAEDAPTILLVHGFPLDHSMWAGQVKLRERFSLLIPDLPGFGQSKPLAGVATIERYADVLAGLVRALKLDAVVFCGLSMGGYIGWEFFARHRSLVSQLVCCNTKASADDEVTMRARQVSATGAFRNGIAEACDGLLPKLFAEETIEENKSFVGETAAVMKACDRATFAASQLMMARRADHSSSLAGIDVPALVVAGSHDVITPADLMQQMATAIPGSRFEVIEQAGHLSPLECPEKFNALLAEFVGG